MSNETRFLTVYEFVDTIILPFYGTTQAGIHSLNWSARWWAHPEVVSRLSALWMRYESLRQQEPATCMEQFLRSHADYHMDRLMGERSALRDCRREDYPTVPLPTSPIETHVEEILK